MRLSIIAAKKFGFSRRYVKNALKSGLFQVDGKIIVKDKNIYENSMIEFLGEKEKLSFDIDDFLLLKNTKVCFIYKPPFVHSERLTPTDKLSVSDIWRSIPDYTPLSRLDYETDGVVGAVYKTIPVNFIEKRYLAIVDGKFPDELILSKKIFADKTKKVKVLDSNSGNKTTMKRIAFNGIYSLISAVTSKAARHQIRAFCAYAGYPISGDKIYGGSPFQRLCLHCESYTINDFKVSSEKYSEKFIELVDFKGKLL